MISYQDVNECTAKIQYCGELHCTNTIGSFSCGCDDGYEQVGLICQDQRSDLDFQNTLVTSNKESLNEGIPFLLDPNVTICRQGSFENLLSGY